MSRTARTAAIAALFVLIFAGLGIVYDRWVVVRGVDRARLSGLVVSAPPPGYTKKPSSSNQVAAASDPFTVYRSLAKKAGGRAGAYSVSWSNPASSDDSATILVSLLPTTAGAAQVDQQARSMFLGPGSFKAESYTYAGAIPVPGVPGGKGAVFTATGKATTPPVAAVAFTSGRAQVLELVGQKGTPEFDGATAAALARAEFVHLGRALPGFSLETSSAPLTASLIYWGVAAGTVVLAVSVPLGLQRTRRRRAQSRARAAQRQHLGRGSKIARRQASRRR